MASTPGVPSLKGCQPQGETPEQAIASIREAIELFLETLTEEERAAALSQEIPTTAIRVSARRRPPWPGGLRKVAMVRAGRR
jgi:predicted RNase H-like HicB family nuclease